MNLFQSARLKLTAWYLFIIMLISVSFSFVMYRMINLEIERVARMQRFRVERRLLRDVLIPTFPNDGSTPSIPFADPDILEEAKNRTLYILLGLNTCILVLSGGFGYVLAGRTLEPIKKMLDDQEHFVSNASHELRTPLTALKSNLEVHLRDEKLTVTDAQQLIKESIEDVDSLTRLTERLLLIARPNAKKINYKKNISSDKVIESALKIIHPLAINKNIRINTKIKAIPIIADSESLVELCVILFENALKYSSFDSNISILSAKKKNLFELTISDNGIGIAKKDLPHIFDRFYQSDNARTHSENQSGYGLGLSIAKQIAQDHHGVITVKSTLNKGSTFTFRAPICA